MWGGGSHWLGWGVGNSFKVILWDIENSSSKLSIKRNKILVWWQNLFVTFKTKCSHAFKISHSKGKCTKTLIKMLKKRILQQKSSRNIFKSMLDMHLMLWGIFETHPIRSLWSYYQLPNPANDCPPTLSQQMHVLSFLKLFLPNAWPIR